MSDPNQQVHLRRLTCPILLALLILLDIRMPGMDGVETCRRLKEMDGMADLPVIFLTAEDDREKIAEGYEAGGIDYVPKPVEKDALLQLVRSLL